MNTTETILNRAFNNEYPSTFECADNGCKAYIDVYEGDNCREFEFDCALEVRRDLATDKREISKLVVLKARYNGEEFELDDLRFNTEEILRGCIQYDMNTYNKWHN